MGADNTFGETNFNHVAMKEEALPPMNPENMKTNTNRTIRPEEDIQPQFWFEWGDEPRGTVSTGAYVDDELVHCGAMRKSDVEKLGLPFQNPYA